MPRKRVVKSASDITKELSKFVTNKTVTTKQKTKKEKDIDDDDYKIKDTTWNDDSSKEINEDVDENEES